MYITKLILTFGIIFRFFIVQGQSNYNDLYFEGLNGKVKSVSKTKINYDSTSLTFGYDKKIVSNYNKKGNCVLELEYLDTNLIQTRVNVYKKVKGRNQRVKKITTHSVDTLNKTINYYYFDETGFDTMIVVCDLDSSYYLRYKYERNEQGLRTRGCEYNAKNGNKNDSFEIFYSTNLLIDSIIFKNKFDQITYIEYYFYNEFQEAEKISYSTGGESFFLYFRRDKHGNWIEQEIYYAENGKKELVSRNIRKIEYY